MADIYGFYIGVILTTAQNWDDPPRIDPWICCCSVIVYGFEGPMG